VIALEEQRFRRVARELLLVEVGTARRAVDVVVVLMPVGPRSRCGLLLFLRQSLRALQRRLRGVSGAGWWQTEASEASLTT
jgi:hypothetical protein